VLLAIGKVKRQIPMWSLGALKFLLRHGEKVVVLSFAPHTGGDEVTETICSRYSTVVIGSAGVAAEHERGNSDCIGRVDTLCMSLGQVWARVWTGVCLARASRLSAKENYRASEW
jgi:hypothetical protein